MPQEPRRFYSIGNISQSAGVHYRKIIEAMRRLDMKPAMLLDSQQWYDEEQLTSLLEEIERPAEVSAEVGAGDPLRPRSPHV